MESKNRWLLEKSMMMIVIFVLALAFERAAPARREILLLVSGGLLLMGVIRSRLRKPWAIVGSYLADGVFLILLESYSRFAINLAIQGIYILLIVDAYRYLSKKKFLGVGIGISLVGMVKFVQQIALEANFLILSQTLFFGMVHGLVLTTLWFSRSYLEEKKKIEEANRRIEALSRDRERARLARELHDSIGHSLTALIMQLEIVKRSESTLSDSGKQGLEEAVGTARQTLTEVRSVVDALQEDEGEKNFREMLKELLQAYAEKTRIQVEMDGTDCLPAFLSREALDLYRIIQESLTNTARHGQATAVKIHWEIDSEFLILMIADNGIGAESIAKGNGLTGMKDRVGRLRGEIEFSGEDGFQTRLRIPR